MPFVAESADNGPIAPPEAEAGETYTCPAVLNRHTAVEFTVSQPA